MTQEIKYRPDIDGLRALAVGSVVLFHAGVPFFGGGYVGVDVFFVISGYLITSIIAREAQDGRFSAARFYERRVRRIFPALFFLLAVASAVASLLLMPADYKEFGESVAATALFGSNLFFWVKSGYFDATADLKPLLHTWSLAVEEQFYLLFPPLIAFLSVRVRWWRTIIAGIAAASLALACLQVLKSPTAAFYSPLARTWELLAGALLAVGAVPPIHRKPLREAAAALGLVLVLTAALAFTSATPFPGAAAILPCLGAALMIHANSGHSTVTGRFLSLKPLVALGLVSYSLYLWHWPILVFFRYVLMRPLSLRETAVAIALGLAMGALSWRWVERPFRRGGSSRSRIFGVASAVMMAAVAFGASDYVLRGAPQRFPLQVRHFAAAADDTNPDRLACDRLSPEDIRRGRACVRGDPAASAPSFALLGDSFADALMPAVSRAAQEHGAKGIMLTYSGCLPLLGTDQGNPVCQPFLRAAIDQIRATPSISKVMIVARLTTAVTGRRYGAWTQSIPLLDDQAPERTIDHNGQVTARGLTRLAAALAPRRIFIVAGLPEQSVDVPRAAALARWLGPVRAFGVSKAVYDARQAPVRALLNRLAQATGVQILDAGPWTCGATSCPAIDSQGHVLFADDNHLSRTGALAIRGVLDPFWTSDAPAPPFRQKTGPSDWRGAAPRP